MGRAAAVPGWVLSQSAEGGHSPALDRTSRRQYADGWWPKGTRGSGKRIKGSALGLAVNTPKTKDLNLEVSWRLRPLFSSPGENGATDCPASGPQRFHYSEFRGEQR